MDATSGISLMEAHVDAKGMAGWIGFAGLVMLIVGGVNAFQGLVAIFDDGYYVITGGGLVFGVSTWGWILLLWGVLLVLAGIGLICWAGMGALVRDP